MKKSIVLLVIAIFIVVTSFSQEVIYKKSGEEISCKVELLDESAGKVFYLELDKATKSLIGMKKAISLSEIRAIKQADGEMYFPPEEKIKKEEDILALPISYSQKPTSFFGGFVYHIPSGDVAEEYGSFGGMVLGLGRRIDSNFGFKAILTACQATEDYGDDKWTFNHTELDGILDFQLDLSKGSSLYFGVGAGIVWWKDAGPDQDDDELANGAVVILETTYEFPLGDSFYLPISITSTFGDIEIYDAKSSAEAFDFRFCLKYAF